MLRNEGRINVVVLAVLALFLLPVWHAASAAPLQGDMCETPSGKVIPCRSEGNQPPPPPPPPTAVSQPVPNQQTEQEIFINDLPTGQLARDGAGLLITFGPMWPNGSMPFETARSYQDQVWNWLGTHSTVHPQYPVGQRDEGSLQWHLDRLSEIAAQQNNNNNQQQATAAPAATPEQEGDDDQQGGSRPDCMALARERAGLVAEVEALFNEYNNIKYSQIGLAKEQIKQIDFELQRLRTHLSELQQRKPKGVEEARINAQEISDTREEIIAKTGEKDQAEAALQALENRLSEIDTQVKQKRARIREIDGLCNQG